MAATAWDQWCEFQHRTPNSNNGWEPEATQGRGERVLVWRPRRRNSPVAPDVRTLEIIAAKIRGNWWVRLDPEGKALSMRQALAKLNEGVRGGR